MRTANDKQSCLAHTLLVQINIRMSNTSSASAPGPLKKSVLYPLGMLLLMAGIILPQLLKNSARVMEPGPLRSYLFLAADLFTVCLFVGVACAIIGARRNRKLKQESPQGAL